MPSKKLVWDPEHWRFRMSHAAECVRLAGLTDDLTVRDQLLDLAQEWMLATQQGRRRSDDARMVPLHTNQDDDGSPGLG